MVSLHMSFIPQGFDMVNLQNADAEVHMAVIGPHATSMLTNEHDQVSG